MEEANKDGISLAANGEEEKFCCDCSHLLGIRHKTDDPSKWRCLHPNNLIELKEEWDYVIGLKKYIRVYKVEDIYALRKDEQLCGSKGNWYEEYVQPTYAPTKAAPKIKGMEATEIIFDEEALRASREAADKAIAERKARKIAGITSIKAEDL